METFQKKIESAWDFRRRRVEGEKLSAFRLINGEADGFPGMTVDIFEGNSLVWLQKPMEAARLEDIRKTLENWSRVYFPEGKNHFFAAANFAGKTFQWLTQEKLSIEVPEGDLRFEVHLGESRHPGLFLDQRENRRRVRSRAQGKKVLNLFCHTGAFTVAALSGDAREVTSVDLSRPYLTWLQRNLALNGIDPSRAPVFAEDVFGYLKRNREPFDLVIVDPPTFSRGKAGAFSTEKNLEQLLQSAAEVLVSQGEMLISINTRGMIPTEFTRRVKETVRPFGLKIAEDLSLPFDFRLTEEERKNPYWKSCWIGGGG